LAALPPDYDTDPGRRRSWQAPTDVFETIAPELTGPVLDAGCGEGRLRAVLDGAVRWVGLDSSPAQLTANPFRPLVRADMCLLPFAAESFAELAHLWCLYHLDDPVAAISEAARVLRPGGKYFACTAARDSDPELVPEGYPPTTFDAEEAADMVASVFGRVETERWDARFFPLETREEVVAYCRHNAIAPERADRLSVPLWLTKRGLVVRAVRE